MSFAAGASQNLYSYRDGLTGYYAIQVGAQNLTSTGTAGDGLISNAVNWSPALAPNAAEAINFNSNAGGTLVGTASALVANFGGTGTWTLHNANLSLTGQPSPPYHPSAFGEGGRLIVDGGTISATGRGDINFEPGRHHGGAGRRTGQFPDHLAWQSTWPGRLPFGHRGRDNVEEIPQRDPHGFGGALLVGVAGGVLNGPNGGAGHVTITSNASVINSGNDAIGANAGSHGDVTVSGGGSLTDNNIVIGAGGSGTLSVNGGTVTSAGFGTIGGAPGGSGTASVSGGGKWTAQGLIVGNNSGSQGTVSVSTGTIIANGNAIIGNSGAGTATIGNGGSFIANGTFDAVGNNAGASGALIVNQGGKFQVGGTNFVVGNNAGSFGSLVINAGGTFKFTGTATASTVLNIGRSAATDAQPGAAGTRWSPGPAPC